MEGYKVFIGKVRFANHEPLKVIAGPCQLESRDHAFHIGQHMKDICEELGMGFVFKASFDKANRTSSGSPRGVGMEKAMAIFEAIKEVLKVPVITDVHEAGQCAEVASVVDALQIPAFLCRQTDLITAAANTGKPVNIKKGQFVAPGDMMHAANKVVNTGNVQVLLTERGSSFGYRDLVVDMGGLAIMAGMGHPVIFDATHSAQSLSGAGGMSGGNRAAVPYLARAAVATGCLAGVFIESHEAPDKAPSDGPVMVHLHAMEDLLRRLADIDKLVKMP